MVRPSWRTTTSRAGNSAARCPRTNGSAPRVKARRWAPARPRPWPSSSKAICGRSRISSTAYIRTGRSSSRAARREMPWRWCEPFMTRPPAAARYVPMADPGKVMKPMWPFCAALLLASPAAAQDRSYARLMKQAPVKAAMKYLRADDARTLQEQVAITQIPAPPFKETVRAGDFASRLRAAGLEDVSIDAAGNVIGKRKGAGKGPLLVVSAHLDTVFAEGSDVTVREKQGRHYGLGIYDDARGLATLLSVLRAMETAKLGTVGDVWFVGTVGEEALGNLRGV